MTTTAHAQTEANLALFSLILTSFGKSHDPKSLHYEHVTRRGFGSTEIIKAAPAFKLRAKLVKLKPKDLSKLPLPALLLCKDGTLLYLSGFQEGAALVRRGGDELEALNQSQLTQVWDGRAIVFKDRYIRDLSTLKSGIGWFLPVMARYKRLFAEVLLISFFIQAFALVSPLFFQVIIDKVLVHRGLSTLDVLVLGLIAIVVFDTIMSFLRTYVLAHTTSRMDVQLGSQLFRHLLSLPASYFQKRPAGQTVARVHELNTVREFLTSSAVTVLTDLVFTGLFFLVMWLYSPTLTLVVLATVPIYILLSFAITPSLIKRVEDRFQQSARNQSFLFENVAAVDTVKSMAITPKVADAWDERLAHYVRSSFRTTTLAGLGSTLVIAISKLSVAVILWLGAREVMEGTLSVGQLVAFNMLASQVNHPIIRSAQLWQDFQQFRISMRRLGDILLAKPEIEPSATLENLPPLQGSVEFQNVSFRYDASGPDILKDISLSIQPGQTIGIVGPSGSGKSTLAKLIQKLFLPSSGSITIDGFDTALLNPAWLRRQIGTVQQESVLFNGTVSENIALAQPDLPMTAIVAAAQVAGAHEFISKLPKAYDTYLDERGANLSGGQRQRIAIARTVAANPRILILDEPTAALDYDSERAFQENLNLLTQSTTTIIIAHRLSTIKRADKIIVMEDGRITAQGKHDDLLHSSPLYARLNSYD